MSSSPHKRTIFAPLLFFSSSFLALLLIVGVLWIEKKFGSVSIDSIIFHLQNSLLGAPTYFIKSFSKRIVACLIGSIAILTIYLLANRCVFKKLCWTTIIILLSLGLFLFENRLNGISYLAGNYTKNHFIEENYASLTPSEIIFPESKRNMIVILAESMEVTFSDNASLPSLTPKLQQLQAENYFCTLWPEKNLSWTIASLTGLLFGVPLFVPKGNNYTPSNNTFLPGALSLLTVLEQHGYSIACIMGSDSRFSGIRNIFITHTKTSTIYDQSYFEQLNIPTSGFWGVRDALLFNEAKAIIQKQAHTSNQPFFILLQTIDTHSPAVSYSDHPQPYGDGRDAFVVADLLISDFLIWLEQQDFFNDTTILIVGDHDYMGKSIGPLALAHPPRALYNVIINPVTACDIQSRQATMLDMGATLLEAIGAKLPSHRFGLGRSLLHPTPTLLEQFGHTELTNKLAGQSTYYNSFFLTP